MIRKRVNNTIVSVKEECLTDLSFHVYLPDVPDKKCNQDTFSDTQKYDCNEMTYFGGDVLAVHTV